MLALPTVLLQHVRREDTHYDWLITPPPAFELAEGRLWTGRVALASDAWGEAGRFAFTPLPPHRRHYLTYQGPVPGNRGSVRRVDAGQVRALQWTDSRRVLDVRLRGFCGKVALCQVTATRWDAAIV